MPQHSRLASFVVGAFCVGHLYAQGLSQWKDPSTHSTRFVTVDKNVQWRCSTGVVSAGRLSF